MNTALFDLYATTSRDPLFFRNILPPDLTYAWKQCAHMLEATELAREALLNYETVAVRDRVLCFASKLPDPDTAEYDRIEMNARFQRALRAGDPPNLDAIRRFLGHYPGESEAAMEYLVPSYRGARATQAYVRAHPQRPLHRYRGVLPDDLLCLAIACAQRAPNECERIREAVRRSAGKAWVAQLPAGYPSLDMLVPRAHAHAIALELAHRFALQGAKAYEVLSLYTGLKL